MSFKFPSSVQGWLSKTEGEWLSKVCGGKTVLEVGSFYGRSTICIAQTARRVVSVDTHAGDSNTGTANTFETFRKNLVQHKVHMKVDAKVGDFQTVGPKLPRQAYDVIFIDACHEYDAVKLDIATAEPLLKPGGIWAFHDYKAPYHPGVRRAVDEFLRRKNHHRWTADTILFVHT